MSVNGVNWTVLMYPAIAIPIAVMGIVKWIRMKRRQVNQSQVVSPNADVNNLSVTSQSAAVYDMEQPAVYPNTKELFKNGSKKVPEESPPMIQSKRWF